MNEQATEKAHEESVREYVRMIQAAEDAGRTQNAAGVETWHGFEVGQRVGEKPDGTGYGIGGFVAGQPHVVVSRREYPGHSGFLSSYPMVPWRDAHGRIWLTAPHWLKALPAQEPRAPQTREGAPLRLGDALPEFAADLVEELRRYHKEFSWAHCGNFDLAPQVHDLVIAQRCRCAPYHGCDAFYTSSPVRRSWGDGEHGNVFEVYIRRSGNVLLDVVEGQISFVSVRYRRDVAAVLDEHFPWKRESKRDEQKRSKKP